MSAIWLTRIGLNTKSRQTPFDVDRTHRLLTLATDSATYLWAHPIPGTLIVQSSAPLNPRILANISTQATATQRTVTYNVGVRLSFAGILAPTRSETRPGQRGKIRSCTPQEAPDWFIRKIGSAAHIDTLTIEDMSPAKGGRGIIHPRAAFSGTLTVHDPKKLTDHLTQGIGRGKRFGTGLLLTKEI